MILHDLKATSGSTAKQMILKNNADTFDKKMFDYAYNSNNVYHLKYNGINWVGIKPITQIDMYVLDRLLSGEIIGNVARDTVHEHCQMYGDLIKLIINKDLDCGVTATTLNKVFGKDFIFQFKAQKAIEVPIRDVKLPVWGQIKYNGIRTVAHVYKDKVLFRTFNGKFFTYPELERVILESTTSVANMVIDGELCIGDSRATNHTDVGGKVNSSIKTGKPILGRPFTFNIFDTLPMQDFDKQICRLQYEVRLKQTEVITHYINNPLVKLSETYKFNTHEEIEQKFDELVRDKYEGMILKHATHMYKFKKTKDWIKLKEIKTCDIKCVGIVEGEGKYEGQIGSLICTGFVEGQQIKVNVGSGLSDAQRAEPWSDYRDTIVEVKYNSIIFDTIKQEWSLFLPRFVAVRFDK